jgi:hypothetical protein
MIAAGSRGWFGEGGWVEMKREIRRGWLVLVVFLLAGCTAETVTQSLATARIGTLTATQLMKPSQTSTPADTATATVTPTATAIPTVEPMRTPSPGPAPDLEILNVAIRGNIFMGEMRNNTDQPMLFPGRESGLRLDFEKWSQYGKYYHDIYSAFIVPEDVYFKKMNCILYPGETGVVTFDLSQICLELGGCQGPAGEDLTSPPKQLGNQLIGYQGLYRRWEDLKDKYPFKRDYPAELDGRYHPQITNLLYRVEDSYLFIEFDAEIYIPAYMRGTSEPSWIILYDHAGRILNILHTNTDIFQNRYETGMYHIYGVGRNDKALSEQWVTPEIHTQWWRPMIELTQEDMRRVDHIRVVFEIDNVDICINPIV